MNPTNLTERLKEIRRDLGEDRLLEMFKYQMVLMGDNDAYDSFVKWVNVETNIENATLETLLELAAKVNLNPIVLSKNDEVFEPPKGVKFSSDYENYVEGTIEYLSNFLQKDISIDTDMSTINLLVEKTGISPLYLNKPLVEYERLGTQLEDMLAELLDILEDNSITSTNPKTNKILRDFFSNFSMKDYEFSQEDIWFLLHNSFTRDEPFRHIVRFGRIIRDYVVFSYIMENVDEIESETLEQDRIKDGFLRILEYRRAAKHILKRDRMTEDAVDLMFNKLPKLIQKDEPFWKRLTGIYTSVIEPIINHCGNIEKSEEYKEKVQTRELGDIPHAFTGKLIGTGIIDDVFKVGKLKRVENSMSLAVINDHLGLLYSSHLRMLGFDLYENPFEPTPDNGYLGYFLNGESFINATKETGILPDVILCDIDLGPRQWNGLQFIEELSDYVGIDNLPKIVLFSFEIPEDNSIDHRYKPQLEDLKERGLIIDYVSKFNLGYDDFAALVGAYN